MEFMLDCPVCREGTVLAWTDADEYGPFGCIEGCTNDCDLSEFANELMAEAVAAESEAIAAR